MSFIKTRCPVCQRKLFMPKSSGHVRCPKCDHRFVINGAPAVLMSRPVSPPSDAFLPSAASPAASASTVATASVAKSVTLAAPPAVDMDVPTGASEPEFFGYGRVTAVAVGAALFVAAGIWLLVICLRHTPPVEVAEEPSVEFPLAPASPPSNTSAASLAAPDQVLLASAKIGLEPPAPAVVKAGAPAGTVKPVKASSRGVDQAKIDQAIERGAKFLHGAARNDGRIGARALAGLTLLHCGYAGADPVVADIAREVRQRAPTTSNTYELALCVMFLDRFGQPSDRDLIQAIALQLIAGQGAMGGWNYQCNLLNPDQRRQLSHLLGSSPTAGVSSRAPAPAKPFQRSAPIPGNLSELPVFQMQTGARLQYKAHGHEDNSLTQFAVLALWTAQKHGVPAERSLALVDARFRASQASDGSWSYEWTSPPNFVRTDSMTCAGLIGLAAGRGNVRDAKLHEGDPAIEKALRFVSQKIGYPEKPPAQRGRMVSAASIGDLYYLWTLERAAVIFDLHTIGGKDWYAWGAPIIVANQAPAGNWQDAHGAVPDTCFALLFLKRANVAQDLTVRLQDLAISKHIGERSRDLDRQPSPADDPFGRRSNLTASQRAAAGYSRGREDVR